MRSGTRHRILLVEDDAALRELVAGHLSRQRFDVVTAESAEEVLDQLRRGALSYDLCLLDLHLPGISGLELSRLLLATAPLRPALLITGDDDERLAREALDQGVTGYLMKPFQLFELDACVSQAVSMLELVEATETLARAQSEMLDDWGDAGGMLPRNWLHLGDERSGAGNGHGARVVGVASLIAKSVSGLDGHDREVLRTAARTHEIGRLLGEGAPREIAGRSAQLLDNLGFDPGVGEVVRDGVVPWSPGLPATARILGLADRLDHDAAGWVRAGVDEEVAIRQAVDEAIAGAGDATDPGLVKVLAEHREGIESMWVLQRQTVVPAAA